MKLDVETMSARKAPLSRTRRTNTETRPAQNNGLRFKSLLVPVDFSGPSLKALDYALGLAAEFGSQLRLLHVLEPSAVFNSDYPAYATWDRVAVNGAKIRLDALIHKKFGDLDSAGADVRLGRAYKIICAKARKEKTDLIILGTHGLTGLKRLFLGSTTEKVVRHAPCSVLVTRERKGKSGKSGFKPKKILVPTDFSVPAKQALDSAIALAKQYNSQIQLLNVVPFHYAVADFDEVNYRVLESDLKEAGEKGLASLSKSIARKNISVVTRLRRGRPATEIAETASETGADLIVISTHGHTGWERALLGSTTEEVVRHAPCPVLVTRKK